MRDQASTKEGKKRYDIIYSKFKKGEYSVREVNVGCTYGYITHLMDTVIAPAEEQSMNSSVVERNDAPSPLCSSFEKSNKDFAILKKTFKICEN